MMAGGRQKSLERMVDRAWCQAIIFKIANNLEEEIWMDRGNCVYKYVQVVTLRKWVASVGFVSGRISASAIVNTMRPKSRKK